MCAGSGSSESDLGAVFEFSRNGQCNRQPAYSYERVQNLKYIYYRFLTYIAYIIRSQLFMYFT